MFSKHKLLLVLMLSKRTHILLKIYQISTISNKVVNQPLSNKWSRQLTVWYQLGATKNHNCCNNNIFYAQQQQHAIILPRAVNTLNLAEF